MALSATTELEAINFMLSTIGESPVSSLNESGNVDAVMARQTLTKVSREVQAKGWHFNTERDMTLTPNAITGEIILPTNCIQVDTVGADWDLDVAQRGRKLYDHTSRSLTFTKSVQVEMVLLLEWDDLPEAARNYIAVRAARVFQKRAVGGTESFQLTDEEERDALTTLKKFDGRTRDVNFLTGSYAVRRVLQRRSVLR
jgi:hypothetical protein